MITRQPVRFYLIFVRSSRRYVGTATDESVQRAAQRRSHHDGAYRYLFTDENRGKYVLQFCHGCA